MNKLGLDIKLENRDKRGSIFRGDHNEKEIFLITEIKKNETRGGHYHNMVVAHHVLRGKVLYKEMCLTKNGNIKQKRKEIKKIVSGGNVIITPAYAAHIITAIEDSIIFEASGGKKETIIYQKYREQIKNS
jgi:hypothetical protein